MDISVVLTFILGFYLFLLFLDRFFKSCSHYGYIQFLQGTGIEVKFLQIRWTTSALNKTLQSYGSKPSQLINLWFNLGVFATLFLLPITLCLLLNAFTQNFASRLEENRQIIELAIPGINIPPSEIGYYSLTFLISSIVHEFGHALAAVKDGVNVINVGANLFFLLPICYVNISNDNFLLLNPWKRLRILSAGVWHNLVIAAVAYLLYISLPMIFSPIYHYGNGVIVTKINRNSPLRGLKGLATNDVIVQVNNCDVNDEEGWLNCLNNLKTVKPGFCVDANFVNKFDESIYLTHSENGLIKCCHSDNKGGLCFEYVDGKDGILELPPFVCLPGRQLVEVSSGFCQTNHDCRQDSFCLKPVLSNSSNLFKIIRSKGSNVIYVGAYFDILSTVTISPFVPKLFIISSIFPDSVAKLLTYLVMFSMGFAIINIVPCVFMDGQHICHTIMHLLFSKQLRSNHIKALSGIVTSLFTFILFIHLSFLVWNKIV